MYKGAALRMLVTPLVCLLIGSALMPLQAGDDDATILEDRLGRAEASVNYLKTRNIDVATLEERVKVIKREFAKYRGWVAKIEEAKKDSDKAAMRQEIGMMRQVIDLSIINVESDLQARISSIRRLDVLYVLTAIAGVGFVIGITFYTIWMYMKRR